MSICLLLLLAGCQVEEKPLAKEIADPAPAYSQVPSNLGLIHEMQGRWKDGKIKGAEVLITGNRFVTIYQKEIRAEARIEAFDKRPALCPKGIASNGLGYFVLHRADGLECYCINRLEFDLFEYTLLQ